MYLNNDMEQRHTCIHGWGEKEIDDMWLGYATGLSKKVECKNVIIMWSFALILFLRSFRIQSLEGWFAQYFFVSLDQFEMYIGQQISYEHPNAQYRLTNADTCGVGAGDGKWEG